jgi:hypothetical protein
MRESVETLLGKLVLVLSRATPEKLAAVYQFATGEPLGSAECRMQNEECTKGVPSSTAGAKGGRDYAFRFTGRDWKVVFDGCEPFYLPDTLGAPYLDYLLHRPNQPISAFELEVAVSPEKGEARATNSIQAESDARALAQYREELRRLQAKRKELEATADADGLEHLDNEVAVLAAALNAGRGANDTGERARSNVRLAVRSVKARLEKQGQEEREFAEHLRTHLSLGYECLYRQPAGRIWD